MDVERSRRSLETFRKVAEVEPDLPPEVPRAAGWRSDRLAGTRLGHYHLVRIISTGGMGSVYEAIQEKPRRAVAVKVMREGIPSKSALRRFEYESQILGRLRHPGIAQVFEAGSHECAGAVGGIPYFVMEYIPNARTITEYAHARELSAAARLRLFVQLCNAVHHGHQKGIIHRDLKPGNILVDSCGQVKVIDFGVARATDSDLALTTLQTHVGTLIGTVQYMSPEQCEGDPHDLDTRSDVYALGVVLYELLCQEPPYVVHELPLLEALRRIREEKPVRPSTTVRALRGDVETIVLKALEKDRELRYQSADELRRDIEHYLRGEPIAARPPSVVYQLRSFARRNRVLVGGVATVFLVLVAGVVTSTSLYFQAESARARTAREAGAAQAINEFFNRMLASVDPNQLYVGSSLGPGDTLASVETRGIARDVSVAEMMRWAAPQIEATFADRPEREALVRETFGMTFFGLGLYEEAEPQMVAVREARRDLLGEDHPDTLRSKLQLGNLRRTCGRYEEAEELLRPTLAGLRDVFGVAHRHTLSCATILAAAISYQSTPQKVADADRLFAETLETERRALGGEDRLTLWTMCEWSFDLARRSELRRAEELAGEALTVGNRRLGPEDYVTVYAEGVMGSIRTERLDYSRGEELLRRALGKRSRTLGEAHPRTCAVKLFLARTLIGEERLPERLRLLREARAGFRSALGEGHHWTVVGTWALARLLADRDRHAELEILLRDRHESCRRALGEEDLQSTVALNGLASYLLIRGRADEGEALYRDRLDSRRERLGAEDPETIAALGDLAAFQLRRGELDRGRESYREWVDLSARRFGDEHGTTLGARTTAARALFGVGLGGEARTYVRTALAGWQRRVRSDVATASDFKAYARLLSSCEPTDLRDAAAALPLAVRAVGLSGGGDPEALDTLALAYDMTGEHERAIETQEKAIAALPPGRSRQRRVVEDGLVRLLLRNGDAEAAEWFLDERLEGVREELSDGSLILRLLDDVLLLVGAGRYDLAEPRARECLALSRQRSAGDPDAETAKVQTLYARCLARTGRHEEAERNLLEGYAGLKVFDGLRGFGEYPLAPAFEWKRLVRRWIVELYEAWGRPDEAEAYRNGQEF